MMMAVTIFFLPLFSHSLSFSLSHSFPYKIIFTFFLISLCSNLRPTFTFILSFQSHSSYSSFSLSPKCTSYCFSLSPSLSLSSSVLLSSISLFSFSIFISYLSPLYFWHLFVLFPSLLILKLSHSLLHLLSLSLSFSLSFSLSPV